MYFIKYEILKCKNFQNTIENLLHDFASTFAPDIDRLFVKTGSFGANIYETSLRCHVRDFRLIFRKI